ncbi:MAG: O-antigen ligase family protein [Candidatus Nomurabacteria bacterium]|jgi:hypothetical protein|nr:O-antigen ligase family protein [Candidatus Nomurabacteria bacterium]
MKYIPRIFSWWLLLVVLAMPVWPFFSTWLGSFGGREVWKSLLTIILAVLMVAGMAYLLVKRRDVLKSLFRHKLVWCASAFAVLVLGSVLFSAASAEAKVAAVAMDLRYFLVFIIGLALAKIDAPFWRNVLAKMPTAFIVMGVVLALIGLAQVLFLPADFLTIFGYGDGTIAASVSIDQTGVFRAFATLRGPNDYAAFLILPLIFALARIWQKRSLWGGLALIVVAAGLFASSSRSAWLAAGLAATLFVIMKLPKTIYKTKRFWCTVAGVVLLGVTALIVAFSNPFLRLHILHIRDGRDVTTATSNEDHASSVQSSVDRVTSQPLGCGAGCSGPASYYDQAPKISENYYLQIVEEYGWLGLALWAAAVTLIAKELWKRREQTSHLVFLAALAGYLVIGLLLHVFVDEPLTVTWFALAGVLIGLPAWKSQSKSAKISG